MRAQKNNHCTQHITNPNSLTGCLPLGDGVFFAAAPFLAEGVILFGAFLVTVFVALLLAGVAFAFAAGFDLAFATD